MRFKIGLECGSELNWFLGRIKTTKNTAENEHDKYSFSAVKVIYFIRGNFFSKMISLTKIFLGHF